MSDETVVTTSRAKAPLGEFKKLRRNTNAGKVVAAVMEADRTLEDLANECGLADKSAVRTLLNRLRVTHGIDYSVDPEDNTVTVQFPDGEEDPFAPEREPKGETSTGERKPRTSKAMEEAAQGIMPTAPDFSAGTHKPWRKRLEILNEMIASEDTEALEKFHETHKVKPISTSPRALLRYRDLALTAIRARSDNQQSVAAE